MRARVAAVLVLGCALVGTGVEFYVTSTSTGTLAIQIHDTPASWSQLTITFTQVAVHPANAAEGSGWISLNLAADRIDFLALGSLTQLLAQGHVAPGPYDEVRIIVGAVQGTLSGGSGVTLSVPNGLAEGTVSFNLPGGGQSTVTVDLDLAQSIQFVGGGWSFTPVLGALSVG